MSTLSTNPFTDDQLGLLAAELSPQLAARMTAGGSSGSKVSYIEAHVVIEQANRIFGFGRWGYKLIKEDADLDPATGGGLYSAWVEVTVQGCEPCVELGDCPIQVGQGKKAVPAQKSMARKGAVTDGMKRGLRHFGAQFGNSLYDKDGDIHRLIDEFANEPDSTIRLREDVRHLFNDDPDARASFESSGKTLDTTDERGLAAMKARLMERAVGRLK